MKAANQAYFERMRGSWNFDPIFKVLSWRGLMKSRATLLNKLRLAAFVIVGKVFGPYKMVTSVAFEPGSDLVRHTTWVKKFGLAILRSEKRFRLDANGFDLSLEGEEYYWPLTNVPAPFPARRGRVDPSGTRARYEMPLVGLTTDCTSVMEAPQAFLKLETPWFLGIFNFTKESMAALNAKEAAN